MKVYAVAGDVDGTRVCFDPSTKVGVECICNTYREGGWEVTTRKERQYLFYVATRGEYSVEIAYEETLSDECETEMCDCCARADWCLRT